MYVCIYMRARACVCVYLYMLLKLVAAEADLSLAEINSFNNMYDVNLRPARSWASRSTSQHLQFQFMLGHYARFILCRGLNNSSRRAFLWQTYSTR